MKPSKNLTDLAKAFDKLTWFEMTSVSQHIVEQIPHMRRAEHLDRDGMAQTLSLMADDILNEANRPDTAQAATCHVCNGTGETAPGKICKACIGGGTAIPKSATVTPDFGDHDDRDPCFDCMGSGETAADQVCKTCSGTGIGV